MLTTSENYQDLQANLVEEQQINLMEENTFIELIDKLGVFEHASLTPLGVTNDTKLEFFEHRKLFRQLTRAVQQYPANHLFHLQRIKIAFQMNENEAIQGTLADYLHGCWYDIPLIEQALCEELENTIKPAQFETIKNSIRHRLYIEPISKFATAYSVIAIPSMDVASHLLRINRDHSKTIIDDVIHDLLEAKDNQDDGLIDNLETEFLDYCLACNDRMAFMRVWFRLSRLNWTFNDQWSFYHRQLNTEE